MPASSRFSCSTILRFIEPVTSSILRIQLVDKETVAKRKEQEAMKTADAEKIKMEEEAREMATAQKKQEMMVKEKSMAEAKQTVEQMLRKFRRPSIMQLSIINAGGWPKRATKLSVYLGKEKVKYIEESLGVKLDIVNISNAKEFSHNETTIYFRDNFLKSALFLAELIPGEQRLVPIDSSRERLGVDIEIYLGKDFKY